VRIIPILLLTAGIAYGAECAAPPVTTAQQAICFAAKYLGYVDAELKALKPSVINRGDAWLVSLVPNDSTPRVGGPGGEAVIDAKSGKMLSGGNYQ
jgi:hypothetical protein